MSKNPFLSESAEHYVTEVMTRETELQRRLRLETAAFPQSVMLTTPDQVALLSMLVKIAGAKRILEVGTFTGYSSLAMATALPADGSLVCCDISAAWTAIARRYWQEAGVEEKIQLHIGPAAQTLEEFIKDGKESSFDMAFVDADKGGYEAYYELCLKLVKKGGIIAFDNMLWHGTVPDMNDHDRVTTTLRNLNAKMRDDERVDMSLLTIADGIMLLRKI